MNKLPRNLSSYTQDINVHVRVIFVLKFAYPLKNKLDILILFKFYRANHILK